MSRILLSVNVVASAALDKDFFAKCLTKNTSQSAEHSTKTRISVVYKTTYSSRTLSENVLFFKTMIYTVKVYLIP